MKLQSPLARAVGLGSAKHGFSHWWWQRVTAMALVPLTLWFLVAVVSLIGAPYQDAFVWLAKPFNGTLMLIFLLTMLYHAQTGLQTVIEDYIHTRWLNLTFLLTVKFAAVVMAVSSTVSVLKIVLGG